jgi:4-oxalocrotonate tautomerase
MKESPMPIVTVELMEGRSLDQKRALALRLTDAVVDSLAVARESVQVHFAEMRRDNVAINGVLQIDKP